MPSRLFIATFTLAAALLVTGCTGDGPKQTGVFVTRDAGSNWLATPDLTNKETKKPKEYPPLAVTAVAVSPTEPNFVVAGTEDDLYQTTDGGGSWTKLTKRLPNPTKAITVQAVRFHPTEPNTYYVTGVSQGYGKLLRSTDRGSTLTDIFTVSRPGQTVTSVLVDAANPAVILVGDQLGGVYRSADGGTTWRRIFATEGAAISSLAQSGSTLFAASVGGGVYRSGDGGQTFVPANGNLAGRQVEVWTMAAGLGALYIGTEEGLFATRDFGASWQALGNPLAGGRGRVQGLAVSGGNVFFATNAVVYRTDAAGNTFLPVQLKLARNIYGLAATPADPNVLYAAGNNQGTLFNDRYRMGHPGFFRFNSRSDQ